MLFNAGGDAEFALPEGGWRRVLDTSAEPVLCDDAAAGALPGGAGVLVRALGTSAGSVREAIESAWAEVRLALLGAPLPPRRK